MSAPNRSGQTRKVAHFPGVSGIFPAPFDATPNVTTISSQRLVVIAVAVALRRGDVAVLVIVVLDWNPRRFFRLIVGFLRRFAVLAGSAHVIPFCRINRHLPCAAIQSNGMTSIWPASMVHPSSGQNDFPALFAVLVRPEGFSRSQHEEAPHRGGRTAVA